MSASDILYIPWREIHCDDFMFVFPVSVTTTPSPQRDKINAGVKTPPSLNVTYQFIILTPGYVTCSTLPHPANFLTYTLVFYLFIPLFMLQDRRQLKGKKVDYKKGPLLAAHTEVKVVGLLPLSYLTCL